MRTTKTLIRLRGCAGWSESSLSAHVRRYVLSHYCPSICYFKISPRICPPGQFDIHIVQRLNIIKTLTIFQVGWGQAAWPPRPSLVLRTYNWKYTFSLDRSSIICSEWKLENPSFTKLRCHELVYDNIETCFWHVKREINMDFNPKGIWLTYDLS